MPVTGIDDIARGLAGSSAPVTQLVANKGSIGTMTPGWPASMWRATGLPAQGAIPGAAAACDGSTLGAFVIPNPSGGRARYLALLALSCSNSTTAIELHDRLAHMGGLNATLTTPQAVGVDASAVAAARRGAADFSDVQWWVEIYADVGATTAANYTVTYTRGDGTAGRTVAQWEQLGGGVNSRSRASRVLPILPAAGEWIRSVESVQLSASTGAAGNFGVTATRRLASATLVQANLQQQIDWAGLGLPEVPPDACVQMLVWPSGTTTGTVTGAARVIEV